MLQAVITHVFQSETHEPYGTEIQNHKKAPVWHRDHRANLVLDSFLSKKKKDYIYKEFLVNAPATVLLLFISPSSIDMFSSLKDHNISFLSNLNRSLLLILKLNFLL